MCTRTFCGAQHADVSFAVVILTGDDKGGPIECEVMQPRGRQNVVFELGYFVGRLSRKQVCTPYEEGVEIPSDFSGIVYIPLDAAGAWRTLLARELKAAGFQNRYESRSLDLRLWCKITPPSSTSFQS